jgi:hypothetical protein
LYGTIGKGHIELFLNLTHNTTLYTVFIGHTKHNIQYNDISLLYVTNKRPVSVTIQL